MSNQTANNECCPKFDPSLWDDKTFEWSDKKFIQRCAVYYADGGREPEKLKWWTWKDTTSRLK